MAKADVAALVADKDSYDTTAGTVQTPEAINGLKLLMSWIPAAVAALAVVIVFFYPLTREKMEKIQAELAEKRSLGLQQ